MHHSPPVANRTDIRYTQEKTPCIRAIRRLHHRVLRPKQVTFLLDDLLGLVEDFFEDLFDNLALVADLQSRLLVADLGKAELVALVEEVLDGTLAVCQPFVELTAALLDNGLVGGAALGKIGLVEGARVLTEVLANSLHLLLTKKALGARTPDELLELLNGLFAEELSREGVNVVSVLHL